MCSSTDIQRGVGHERLPMLVRQAVTLAPVVVAGLAVTFLTCEKEAMPRKRGARQLKLSAGAESVMA